MSHFLSETEEARYREFKEFVCVHVESLAEAWDREEQIPRRVIARMGEAGHFGIMLPRELGGQGQNTVTFGLLNEAVGRGSSAARWSAVRPSRIA